MGVPLKTRPNVAARGCLIAGYITRVHPRETEIEHYSTDSQISAKSPILEA